MSISSGAESSARQSRHFTPEPAKSMLKPPREAQYLINEVGAALKPALEDVTLHMPRDPIEYLAHYLYKYADSVLYHQKMAEIERLTKEEAIRKEQEVREEIERARERKRIEEEEKRKAEEARREAEERRERELEEQKAEAEAAARLNLAAVRENTQDEDGEEEGGVTVTIHEPDDDAAQNEGEEGHEENAPSAEGGEGGEGGESGEGGDAQVEETGENENAEDAEEDAE